MRVLLLGNSNDLRGGAHAAFLDNVKVLQADDSYIIEEKSLESFGGRPADVNFYKKLNFFLKSSALRVIFSTLGYFLAY